MAKAFGREAAWSGAVTTRRDEAIIQAWSSIKGAIYVAMQRIGDQQSELGVAGGHMGFLHALNTSDRALTPGELGERLKLMPATVTGALTALEEQGLVVRAHSAADRREVLVTITPRGRDIAKRAGEIVMRTLHDLFAPVSESELSVIAAALARVAPPISGPPPSLLPGVRHDAVQRPTKTGTPRKSPRLKRGKA